MVANGVGVIDQDYCGPADEVKIQVLNFTAAPVQVARGDRIAQGLFIPVARAEWQEADGDLRDGSRAVPRVCRATGILERSTLRARSAAIAARSRASGRSWRRSNRRATPSSRSTCSTTTSRAESALTERAVYERDIAWLEACDILIADASGSSFGVGFEVGYVLGRSDRTDQRVVLLYRADRRDHISRLIVGNAHRAATSSNTKTRTIWRVRASKDRLKVRQDLKA